ncbi:MAG: excinuclease ABC subunit UvrA, partial [Candidatus Latescibacterota bacterium]
QRTKPDVDEITGLSPTIAIEQRSAGRNPRSTVGTITEIYDYLRVLFARVGIPHCPVSGAPIAAQTRDQIVARVAQLPEGTHLHLLAPLVRERRGHYRDLFEDLQHRGYLRVRVDGEIFPLEEMPELDRYRRHTIDLVVDRLVLRGEADGRLGEAVDSALALGDGHLVAYPEGGEDLAFSTQLSSPVTGLSFPELTPQMFSFNNPQGMCPQCHGLGTRLVMSERLMVPDPGRSILQGAIEPLGEVTSNKWRLHLYAGAARALGFALDAPWQELTEEQKEGLLHGLGDRKVEFRYTNNRNYTWSHTDRYEGIVAYLEGRYLHGSERIRGDLGRYMGTELCSACGGGRLRPEAMAVTIAEHNLSQLTALPIGQAHRFFQTLELDEIRRMIAEEALKEIRGRLQLLVDIGLDYLTLDRGAHTLSGGEAQRIRLASQIGSGLVGVLYVLDEPSIGLHHRDNQRLLDTLKRLRDLGNTVVVVEHDEDTIRQADLVVDFGPGAGERGGRVVACGSPAEVARVAESQTGQYLAGRCRIEVPSHRRPGNGHWLTVVGARHHNLRDLTVRLPLGLFTCVTGVSGSGKSSLVNDILYKALDRQLHRAQVEPGEHERIEGVSQLDKVIRIDQKPIGRTPRSNPATYTDVFTPIRQLFARLADARLRGYDQGRFSFNVKGGRCEACEGNGATLVEMEFLADVWVRCEACEGRRFNRETLTIKYKGKSIAEVLEMEVEEALAFFANLPHIHRTLQTLNDVGLGYIRLGQPAPTLSGGEAQRVKLARELCRRSTGRTVYLLDEPTTGLHFADVDKLLRILHTFAEAGNTVVVIEHNLEVIKTADYLIDMGPEGGEAGGLVIACGTPEEVCRALGSYTGEALREVLTIDGHAPERRRIPRPPRRRPANGDGFVREIEVVGARMHNLKGINVRLPREKMTVVSGVSGSGKSSLAFDTIYAEGQRRYVESLSAYARQFLDQMEKPKVERVVGLSPAIAIEQKPPSRNPRSTVGTVTEVYDYLRALFATLGTQYCPGCQVPVGGQTPDQMVDRILQLPAERRIVLTAPIEPKGNEGYEALLQRARADGFARARIDGDLVDLTGEVHLERRHRHRLELVVDRLQLRPEHRARLREGVERALELSGGLLLVVSPDEGEQVRFSRHLSCPQCGRTFDPLAPQSFSFNHREGMCPDCEGLGESEGLDRELIVADRGLTLRQGAITLWGRLENPGFERLLETVGRAWGFDLDTPVAELSAEARHALFYGAPTRTFPLENGLSCRFRGILPPVDDFARQSARHKRQLRPVTCAACEGSRLRPESRAVRLRERTIVELTRLPLRDGLRFFEELELSPREAEMSGELLHEVRSRLRFLDQVGLGYLDLMRRTATLSGGEAQRIRLASQIGSGLTGVLYLLDEPTIGLHPRDNRRLLDALRRLQELGNTLVLVEHDRDTLEAADHIVDLGPGAGAEGGEVVGAGTPAQLRRSRTSLTGAYLAGRLQIPVPSRRRTGTGRTLTLRGAAANNLRSVDVAFPLGTLICVTGVSGSGKSSLVQDVLHRALEAALQGGEPPAGEHRGLEGIEHLDKVIDIDQTPIGHSPRSTPATVMGIFDLVRQLYARLPEARLRAFDAGRFSFNKAGGRCEACEGLGWRCIEMHFLPDVWVPCDACHGKRYNQDVLRVRFRGRSIADVLDLPVRQALELFASVPRIHVLLRTLDEVGLGYMALGQSSTTLSGGEAQRLKLAAELARPDTGRTIYILDEPTTGLHAADIARLLTVFGRLVDAGNTMVVVEHNLDVIKTADHVIDLGPEGGDEGGRIVAQGPPEEVARVEGSHTGRFLRQVLSGLEGGGRSSRNRRASHAEL